MTSAIKKCPRKDESGNHFVHQVRFNGNWMWPKYVAMCNSLGKFQPVEKVHAKRKVKP